jgi:hypothetical protein
MSEVDSANSANTSPVNDSAIRSRPRFSLTSRSPGRFGG